MGFLSTVLAALRWRASDIVAVPQSWPAYRLRADTETTHRARVSTETVHRARVGTVTTHRVRVNTG